jgi:hypothetical protein
MEVHEHVTIQTGRVGRLKHDFLHYAYADIASWVEKHNRYSSWEAHVAQDGIDDGVKPKLLGSGIERKRWLRQTFNHLPCRPTLRFLYHYVARLGFLDGRPGFILSRLMAVYEIMNLSKRYELKQRKELPNHARVGSLGHDA